MNRARLGAVAAAAMALVALPGAEDPWAALAPASAELVLAAPSAAATAGMFGHILVVVHGAGGSVALTHAAAVGDDPAPLLAWRGLTWGYTARLSIDPWHDELRAYQQAERRSVWAYPLRLAPEGLGRLLEAAASAQADAVPYHLLQANCTRGIAELLDAAAPGAGIASGLGACAMPGDLLRAADRAGLLGPGSRLPGPGRRGRDPRGDLPAARVDLGGGSDDGHAYAQAGFAPAWRTRDDAPASVPPGDALEVLAVALRRYEGSPGGPRIERLALIAIDAHACDAERPVGLGWSGDAGLRRHRTRPGPSGELQPAIAGSFGPAWAPVEEAVLWLAAAADLRLVDGLASGAAGFGGAGGAVADLGALRADLRLRLIAWGGGIGGSEGRAALGGSIALGSQLSLRAEAAWQASRDRAWLDAGARLAAHF